VIVIHPRGHLSMKARWKEAPSKNADLVGARPIRCGKAARLHVMIPHRDGGYDFSPATRRCLPYMSAEAPIENIHENNSRGGC